MNKYDSECITGMLEALGACSVDTIEDADIVIFMTCCVREAADTRLYGQVSSIKNVKPRKDSPLPKRIIAVGGCIGQRDGNELLKNMHHVDVVFGTHNIRSLPSLLFDSIEHGNRIAEIYEKADGVPDDLPITRENTWSAWLPISIGCNNFCSYCIVPYVRGQEKSLPLESIERKAKEYVDSGVKEITLLGQNVNSYGRDLYGTSRFEEVLDIVDSTGIERLRFATSHPKDLTDETIQRFKSLRSLQPALHLPAQSGSNSILKKMNRHYTHDDYLTLVDKLRDVCPDIALSTDIIVGFPGETDEDFEQTLQLVDEVGYVQVFTFIYSKREGTRAAKIEDNTPHEIIQERFDRLVDLVQKRAFEFNQNELNGVTRVLVDGVSKRDSAILSGKSPKNQTVHAYIPRDTTIRSLQGSFVDIRITDAKTWYLFGEVV